MSQVYLSSASSPAVPNSFATDSGTAVPVLNVLTILGDHTPENNNTGIQTSATGSTVTVELTNRYTNTATTTDDTLTTLITVPMGAVAGTIYVYGNVQSFSPAIPASAGFSFSGGYRTDGATATELGTEFHDTFQDLELATADIFLSATGNNILIEIQGTAADMINWNGLLEFRIVT